SATQNWTDSTGTNASAWARSVGIFGGTGGTVTAVGAHGFDRLEFAVSNYEIDGTAGNTLHLSPYSAAKGEISVDNGGDVATIGIDIANGNNYSAGGLGPVISDLEKTGAGTLIFTGTKSYTGLTTVSSGSLQLGNGVTAGGLTGGVTVDSAARFGGAGNVGGDIEIKSGATLFASQGGILSTAGDLTFENTTSFDVNLTAPSSTALVQSNSLSLGGVGATTINLDSPGAPGGLYALINSATAPGAPDPTNQFTLGANVPGGSTIVYTPVGHIYLSVPGGGPALRYWDGATTSGTAPISGGNGIWNTYVGSNTNWGDADPPTSHGVWSQGDIAIFDGSAGTVTVDTNGGASPIEVGGLQFAENGYSVIGDPLTLDSATADNLVEIAVGPSASTGATINSILNGTSGINKTGAGFLSLTATNSYSGDTTITNGVLAVSSNNNLGDASSKIAFAGGTLETTGSFTIPREIIIDQHNGTVSVANMLDTLTLSGPIGDKTGQSGALIKSGSGTLVLTGPNSYSGGTAVMGGIVSVAGNANLGDPTGGVRLDGGTLKATAGFDTSRIFQLGATDNSIDVEGTGNVLKASGNFVDMPGVAGSFTKTGSGKLVMTGAGAHTGLTSIAEGTLQLGDGGATGSLTGDVDVAKDASFNVLRSADWAFAGKISGTGTFNQTGTGTTSLTGDSSGFNGATSLTAGGLAVSGKLGGALSASGGLLSGNGTLGSVHMLSGSRITAGSDTTIETLNTGKLAFDPGSSLLANVEAQQQGEVVADLIAASDAVAVSGGQITVDARGGTVVDGEQVTIVSSAQSVTVQDGDGDGVAGFDPEVQSTSAYVGADVGYTSDTVFLTLKDLTKGGSTLCLPGMTANQCATAGGINSLGPDNPLKKIITGLPSDQLGPDLDTLSGQMLSSLDSGMLENSRFVRDATNTRLREALGEASSTRGVSVANYASADEGTDAFNGFEEDNNGLGLWATGYGSWTRFSGSSDLGEMKDNVGGGFAGIDIAAFENMRFGAVVGYGYTSSKVSAYASSATSSDYTFGVYGGGVFDSVGLNFGSAYTWHDIESKRDVNLPGLSEQEVADYGAGTFQVYGDVGIKTIEDEAYQIEPFLNAAYVNQQTDGFTESGGFAALTRQKNSMNTGFTTVGLRGEYVLPSETLASTITGSVGWLHAYGDTSAVGTVSFAGGSPFQVVGVPLSEDQAVVSVGWQGAFSPDFTLQLDYTGLFGDQSQSQNLNARINLRF
ncbi:autotransporter domain-containing protein, partial [Martelella sp. FLE1502]